MEFIAVGHGSAAYRLERSLTLKGESLLGGRHRRACFLSETRQSLQILVRVFKEKSEGKG